MRLPRSVRAETTTTKAMIVEEVSFSYICDTASKRYSPFFGSVLS